MRKERGTNISRCPKGLSGEELDKAMNDFKESRKAQAVRASKLGEEIVALTKVGKIDLKTPQEIQSDTLLVFDSQGEPFLIQGNNLKSINFSDPEFHYSAPEFLIGQHLDLLNEIIQKSK